MRTPYETWHHNDNEAFFRIASKYQYKNIIYFSKAFMNDTTAWKFI